MNIKFKQKNSWGKSFHENNAKPSHVYSSTILDATLRHSLP